MSQMYALWDAEREFFGGQDPMNYKSKGPVGMKFTGETIGTIVFDPINQDFKIIPLKENESAPPENPTK